MTRCETLKSSPVFRRLIHKKRCVVPLDGFYEWKEVQQPGSKKPAKQPYYVHYKDGSLMMMAGLYDVWTNEGGDKLYSYTIITTAGSKQLEWLHNRMPVILQGADIDRWLSAKPLDEAFDAKHNPFVPLISDNIVWHPVDQRSTCLGKLRFVCVLHTAMVHTSEQNVLQRARCSRPHRLGGHQEGTGQEVYCALLRPCRPRCQIQDIKHRVQSRQRQQRRS